MAQRSISKCPVLLVIELIWRLVQIRLQTGVIEHHDILIIVIGQLVLSRFWLADVEPLEALLFIIWDISSV